MRLTMPSCGSATRPLSVIVAYCSRMRVQPVAASIRSDAVRRGAPWLLEGERLAEGKRDAVRLALYDQERAGIDIVTDGEQTRRHFVTTLIESLDGVDFQHKKTVRIRSRYDADVPVVVGPVVRRHPIYVDDARFLRG